MSAKKLFGARLKEAEWRFGPRSRKISIRLESRDNITPETVADGPDACIVYYFRAAKHDSLRLEHQLAHETIHVISGVFKREATKFEEGFAVWFSLNYRGIDPGYSQRARVALSPLFADALSLFEKLNPTDDQIKTLRSKCSSFDGLTPHLIKDIFGVSDSLADELCKTVPSDINLR